MRILILAIYMVSLSVASGAAGTNHFPLTEGVVNGYEFSTGQLAGTYITYFSGTADVGGTTTHVRHYAGGVHSGLLHFWSETAEGDKFFHGSDTPFGGYYFFPPILMIDEPLYVGKTWVVDSRASDSLAVRIHFEVTAFGQVTVPAGAFQAFTVEDTWEFPEQVQGNKNYPTLWGIPGLAGTARQVSRSTYADGIGLIQQVFGGRTDRLISRRTVGVESVTWTRIRMLYR